MKSLNVVSMLDLFAQTLEIIKGALRPVNPMRINFFLCLIFSIGLMVNVSGQSSTPKPASIPTPQPFTVQMQAAEKDFMDYLAAALQLLTVIGLGLYVYKTWHMASEMKAARIQDLAPNVIAYIDADDLVFYLNVKNTGRSVATDVRLKFEPPLISGLNATRQPEELDLPLITQGAKSLAPTQEIRTPLDTVYAYFKDELPSSYDVEVSYAGVFQKKRTTTHQRIDLSMYKGLMVAEQKTEEDLIKAVEELSRSTQKTERHLDKIARVLIGGIALTNPELFSFGVESQPNRWMLLTLVKLKEVRSLWKYIEAEDVASRQRLQSKLSLSSSQILLIASSARPNIADQILNSLLELSRKLNELSVHKFTLARESFDAFNDAGNKLMIDVEILIEELEMLPAKSTTQN